MGRWSLALGLAFTLALASAASIALGATPAQISMQAPGSSEPQEREVARRRQRTFGLVVGGLTVIVGAAGALLLRRARNSRRGAAVSGQAGGQAETARAARASEGLGARPKICPTCGERYESRSIRCSTDGTELVLLN